MSDDPPPLPPGGPSAWTADVVSAHLQREIAAGLVCECGHTESVHSPGCWCCLEVECEGFRREVNRG